MKNKITIVLLIIILAAVFWQWWFPGPRVATDFSIVSLRSITSQVSIPQAWSVSGTEGLGEYAVFTLWSWPLNFLQGILANFYLSFAVVERIIFIIPFLTIGSFGIWKLCKYINLSTNAKVVSTIFYLTNTYILLVIDGGQLTIALAYAFFPLAYLTIEKSIEGGFKLRILAGLLVSVIGIFDFRFIFIIFLLGVLRFLYGFIFLNFQKYRWWILSWVKTGLVIFFIIVGLNFYWILVLFKAPLPSSVYANLTQTSFVSFISLGHALMMLSPHWFKNVFGQITNLRFEFLFLPVLVFMAPIFKLKNKQVGFWLLVAVVSIFLTKGPSEPFPKLYPWLYSHFPGFSLFRDSSKFFFLVSLSYAILIGITTEEILRKINRFPKIRLVFLFILVSYLIFLINPVWLNKMTGTFSSPPLQKEYSQLNNLILNDQRSGNIFWIPTISPLTNLDTLHPSLEASRLAQKRPFSSAIVGSYEIFNYLREASYMNQLFDVAGIGYIVYPFLDSRRNIEADDVKYYYTFLNQLSGLPWLERVSNSVIPLLKVREHRDKFFITPNTWWVIGSDDIYKEATYSGRLSLSKNALIFAEESAGLGKRLDELLQAKIALYKKTPLDLAASFINKESLIFPAQKLGYDPDQSGWWKRETSDLLNWRDFLKSKYQIDNKDFDLGGGWAVGEGKLELRIKNEELRKDRILIARVMESSRGGSLRIYQGNQETGGVSTKISGDANVRWFEVGQLKDDSDVVIQTEGDINVINAITILDKDIWLSYLKKAEKLKNRVVDFDEKNAEGSDVSVTYEQINPTKYIVHIQNLTEPMFLVFSQNFDRFWKLGDQQPFPIYSLLNGFKIGQNGDYTIEFAAQKYVMLGLAVTALTIVIIFILLTKTSKPRSKI